MADKSCSDGHIGCTLGALSVDIDASGSFLGSLKGLAIATSLCDSETT